MKGKKIITFLLLTVLLFSCLFSGCDTNAAKNSADIYCSLIFKSNTENLQKIGVSDSKKDELIKGYEDKIKEQLKKNLLLTGDSASDEQLNSICEAYKEALSKISYETKQISKSGDTAEIEISTSYLDVKKIDEEAAMEALDETDKMEFSSSKEETNKFNDLYLSKIVEKLKTAEVSSEKSSKTFIFKKVKKYWAPDDTANFSYKLVRLATNKNTSDLNINEESISPEESAKVFWNLVINEDSSGIDKLGYSKAFGDRIVKKMDKSDFKTLKDDFNKSNVSLSDDQIQGIIGALRNAISRSTADFKEISKTDNSAKVKVSATSINISSIIKTVENTTKNQITSGRITNKQKAIDAYAANLIDEINKAQPSSDNKEKTYSFTKIGDLWLPSNITTYSQGIVDMCIK